MTYWLKVQYILGCGVTPPFLCPTTFHAVLSVSILSIPVVREDSDSRAPGKLTGCEHDFGRLLYISKNFFLIQGTIKNSFKLQSCPFRDESYRV